ncbi:gliding motility protein [Stigmatella sp. ncwal1]|uniref:Gliding motility protein n=1 Tax=Stigmatella ashevillensis TaxID=2995309 RepID=A0ABT5D6E3_9BACT|nr:gliding motility protein [Stigmatella ashevillena]MDC0708438.1 gliding motility protein [Stigmatella ashevillena]
MRFRRLVMLGVLVALCGVGCKREEANGGSGAAAPSRSKGALVGGMGTLLAPGRAADLRVSPNGQFLTYLMEAKKPRLDGIPPQMVLGELYLVPVAGGTPRKVGEGVTNAPGGLLFTPEPGHVLFLGGYNPAIQAGALYAQSLTDPTAEPVKLGESVTYMLPSPDGQRVAFVDGGVLKMGPLPKGPFQDVGGEVSTAQFTPDGQVLLFKRKLVAAGGLAAVRVAQAAEAPRKLGDYAGDYEVSKDGRYVAWQVRSEAVRGMYDLFIADVADLKPRQVATGTKAFGFSPDSRWLARTENGKPEQLGDLFVGPANGSAGRKVGERVEEFAFAPDSQSLGFLERYDPSARAGLMSVVQLPDGTTKQVGNRVPNFTWGSEGKYVAFLSRFLKPVYSVDLMIYPVGAEAAEKVHPGVFGYGFTPGDHEIVFRTNCIREGRACDFKAQALPKTQPEPATWLQGIFSYKLSTDGQRVLVSYARMDSDAYDVAVYDVKTQARKTLEQRVQIPAYFAGEGDSRVVFLVQQGSAPGVYVAPAQP